MGAKKGWKSDGTCTPTVYNWIAASGRSSWSTTGLLPSALVRASGSCCFVWFYFVDVVLLRHGRESLAELVRCGSHLWQRSEECEGNGATSPRWQFDPYEVHMKQPTSMYPDVCCVLCTSFQQNCYVTGDASFIVAVAQEWKGDGQVVWPHCGNFAPLTETPELKRFRSISKLEAACFSQLDNQGRPPFEF